VRDEIYEKMIYNRAGHISSASLPNMALRTLTLNGFSKNYTMTGWRIESVAAPATLIVALLRIRQYVTICPTTSNRPGKHQNSNDATAAGYP
jgi:aspartate/methionine/tyrosine aminotransferase